MLFAMNIYLGHLSNFIKGPKLSTTVRAILDQARASGKQTPPSVPERTLAIRLPQETIQWLRQQADQQDCAMAQVARAYIAQQVVSDLTAHYQQNSISAADFSALLWVALGYEPEASPEEEVDRKS
jgi:hypothetical protein